MFASKPANVLTASASIDLQWIRVATTTMNTLSTPMFQGFSKPEANFFRLPNEWTDITAKITSLAEMKLVEYGLKHTWGYSEFDMVKKLTTDEFRTGRSKKDGTRIDEG